MQIKKMPVTVATGVLGVRTEAEEWPAPSIRKENENGINNT